MVIALYGIIHVTPEIYVEGAIRKTTSVDVGHLDAIHCVNIKYIWFNIKCANYVIAVFTVEMKFIVHKGTSLRSLNCF